MAWVFVIIMGFFGFGIGRAIKLYYLDRDNTEYIANLKLPIIGLSITFFVSVLLFKFNDMPVPVDNWITWLILVGPFISALFANESTLRAGE